MVFLLHLVEHVDGPITIKANSMSCLSTFLFLLTNMDLGKVVH